MDPRFEAALEEALGGIGERLAAAVPAGVDVAALARYLKMTGSPRYAIQAAVGFADGFVDGFLAGGRTWRQEMEAALRLVGVGVTVGLAEFFVRPVVEEAPQGLLPQTRRALEDLNSIRVLTPVFRWLDQAGPGEIHALLADLVPTKEDLVVMIGRATTHWLNGLFRTAPDAVAAGHYLGELVGRAVLEILRAVCEPDALMTLSAVGALEAGAGEDLPGALSPERP